MKLLQLQMNTSLFREVCAGSNSRQPKTIISQTFPPLRYSPPTPYLLEQLLQFLAALGRPHHLGRLYRHRRTQHPHKLLGRTAKNRQPSGRQERGESRVGPGVVAFRQRPEGHGGLDAEARVSPRAIFGGLGANAVRYEGHEHLEVEGEG